MLAAILPGSVLYAIFQLKPLIKLRQKYYSYRFKMTKFLTTSSKRTIELANGKITSNI